MEILLVYLATGAVAGLIAGLLGLGGGVVIVPALAFLLPLTGVEPAVTMHVAVGTSLAAIIPTAISSTYAHARRQSVRWSLLVLLAPGIAIGALLGARIASLLPTTLLARLFGIFVIGVALQILFARTRIAAQERLPGRIGLAVVAVGIGTLSAILGIGGGSLTVPYLAHCGVAMRQAVATSAGCGIVLALVGATGFIVSGWQHPALPAHSLGFVYLPALAGIVSASVLTAPVGARMAHYLPAPTLKRIFAVFLILVGVRLLSS
ncbi:MAG: sulfite exporter TauE/SafE family protein [Pseudomonadales bacterium]|nr:sulfite exporter TauE/SafE family protein [Pseudomonadales bacterium]